MVKVTVTRIAALFGASAGVCVYRRGRKSRSASEKNVYSYTSPPTREEMIEKMKKEKFDVFIIGGGATGAGCALDAASRGLSCALVERDDFASGTSSKSTKLVHGGLRYLEAAFKKLSYSQFKLVSEGLRERSHVLKACPYMTNPIPMIMPLYKYSDVGVMWFGVKMYDWISRVVCNFDAGVPSTFYLNKSNTKYFIPHLNTKKLKGSMVVYDGQTNDSVFNVDLIQTATIDNYVTGMKGATVANHCSLKNIENLKDHGDEVKVLTVEDHLSGESFKVQAKTIMNCAGPFVDSVRDKELKKEKSGLVQVASGIHMILPKYFSSSPFGLMIPKTTDGRVLFFLPWQNNTIAGTTDELSSLSDEPVASDREVNFVVDETCRYLDYKAETVKSEITAAWSGLRPLISNPKKKGKGTKSLLRTHLVLCDKSGMISVLGGKWTTYRQMAEDGIDKLLKVHRKKFKHLSLHKVRTYNLLLLGAVDPSETYKASDINPRSGLYQFYLVKKYGVTMEQAKQLCMNYGFRSAEVCEMGRKTNTLHTLTNAHPEFLAAEVLYATRCRLARTPADVIGRRIRLGFIDVDATKNILDEVVRLMGSELGWSHDKKMEMKKEGDTFLETMHAQSRVE